MTISPSDFRRGADDTWLGAISVVGNPAWEVELDGGDGLPDEQMWATAREILASADELVKVGIQHLRRFSRFGADTAWYPDGVWLRSDRPAGDLELRVTLLFSIEDDFYGLWTVDVERIRGRWHAMSLTRRQE